MPSPVKTRPDDVRLFISRVSKLTVATGQFCGLSCEELSVRTWEKKITRWAAG